MKILIAYDGSMCADSAIEDMRRAGLPPVAEALVLTVSGSELNVLPGTDTAEMTAKGLWEQRFAEAEVLAETAGNRIQSYFPRWQVSIEALWGSPAKIIVDMGKSWHADLIVTGSHGRSPTSRFFLGSVSMQVMHHAHCSVRITRTAKANDGPVRILLGNDGSNNAEAMIQTVAQRSWPEKTEARIVSVAQILMPPSALLEGNAEFQEPAMTVMREVDERERVWLFKTANDSAEQLRRAGLSVSETLVEGDPRQQIIEEADRWSADAIFVGARGLGRLQRMLLGSVSSYVASHANCTVEVIH
jgi:nucleotide-binding universal stress UspA family protein